MGLLLISAAVMFVRWAVDVWPLRLGRALVPLKNSTVCVLLQEMRALADAMLVPQENLPYRLALWHEGYPIAKFGDDIHTFEAYMKEMVSFCISWSFSRCYLQIFNPSSATTLPYSVFEPANVAKSFLDPLTTASIDAGFVAYARPKDTGWDRNDPLDIAEYIAKVEAASSSNGKIVALSFDHEDLVLLARYWLPHQSLESFWQATEPDSCGLCWWSISPFGASWQASLNFSQSFIGTELAPGQNREF